MLDTDQFSYVVRDCVGLEHGTPLSLQIVDGVYWSVHPHFKIGYDTTTRIFTFIDFNCSTEYEGFILRYLVPGYLR